MAEGGFDEIEMGERGEKYPEYDDLSTEDLDSKLDELHDRLRSGNDPLITERIAYIENLQSDRVGEAETPFGDGLTTLSVRNDTYIQLDKYAQDSRSGDRLNPYTDSMLELRRKVTIKDSTVTFKVRNLNGTFSKIEKIVLNRMGNTYVQNPAQRNRLAVIQFEGLIDKAVNEAKERESTTANLPMVDRRGPELSPDVLDRLSVEDRRVANGVLNPSDTILPESRIGDQGAIQLVINDFRERAADAFERALMEDDANIAEVSFQEADDLDISANAFEQQRIREETREAQEDDVTRLQKVKEWLKENWLGASAIGITVASLITTIIVGMRTAIMKGAQATKSFAKAVKDAIAKLGPWAVGLANLVYTIIKAGVSALTFLMKNLWILIIAVSYFLWEMYKERKR